MNILYCGDQNMEDGLIISVLSLLKHADEALHIYVFTMEAETKEKKYFPVSDEVVTFLDRRVKQRDEESFVRKSDLTEEFKKDWPQANIDTRFTPYCMLRLFADEIPELPDRILYLDNDVICRRNFRNFYETDLEGYELAGVLDYYGKWFFRKNIFHMDYMNSGVLLLNMKEIRRTGLFSRCRRMCREKKMFMPDQSAINMLAGGKKRMPRKYNEQRKLQEDTVLQHFTTSFRLFPWLHTLTVKPWQIEKVHSELKLYEYDDILEEYQNICMER